MAPLAPPWIRYCYPLHILKIFDRTQRNIISVMTGIYIQFSVKRMKSYSVKLVYNVMTSNALLQILMTAWVSPV